MSGMTMIVSLKYAILILRADNYGEGGIVTLLALLDARAAKVASARSFLLVVGLVGAALLMATASSPRPFPSRVRSRVSSWTRRN
jgi:K+ transporter